MTIHPFWAGVLVTVFLEMTALLVWGGVTEFKRKKGGGQ
jgi:hypothetical protein